ncbi:DoxX family protein [Photobacterium frigidiphilum]|uniref:DoxX family protein n=1 Tax=Photobacterium frigidiphilum TaxID=264736 RepID=UPI003D09E0C0
MKTLNTNKNTHNMLNLLGRLLLVILFILSGIGKITGYEGAQQYMDALGVPSALLPSVILLELGGSLLLIVGYQTRLIALLMAGYSVITALIFHQPLSDQIQFLMFWKNISMAGGFLMVASSGAGLFSFDALRQQKL